MSDTIWVDIQGRAQDDIPSDNSIMLRLKDELDRLSETLRLPKLSQFYDYSELEAQYADFADEAEAADGGGEANDTANSKSVWFDPKPALAAVRAIHDHLAQHPEDLGFKATAARLHWTANLMQELQHCQTVLEKAAAHGLQFRFLIVP